MKLGLTLFLCCCYSFLVAQTDSSWIDLGRTKLRKEFTQTVTIKAKDIQQMPFSTLDEALNVWLSGLLTTKNTVTYVVDGSILADVHAYSIHDIEEITLVQNAVAHLNGGRQNQLVLITTKNKTAKTGVTLSGGLYAVKNSYLYSGTPTKSETNLYHRYDIAVRRNTEKLQYGFSLGYLHDVYPYSEKYDDIGKPYQLNRFRVHGYVNYKLDAKNDLWVRAGYIPANEQAHLNRSSYSPGEHRFKNRESLVTVEAGLNTAITSRLSNEFSAGYSPSTLKGNYDYNYASTLPGQYSEIKRTLDNSFNSLLLSDRVNYHMEKGGWSIDPAIDLSFRAMKSKNGNTYLYRTSSSAFNFSENKYSNKFTVFLITPSVDLSYKNIFNIQTGVVFNTSKNKFYAEPKKVLPYVTTTVDVLKAFGTELPVSWKVFGSYASAGNFVDEYYPISNVTASTALNHPSPEAWPVYTAFTPAYGGDSANRSWQVGTNVAAWKERLQISYNFENDRNAILYVATIPGTGGPVSVVRSATLKTATHRVGITAKLLQGKLQWVAGLNASSALSKLKDLPLPVGGVPPWTYDEKRMWTGGFTNRVQAGKLLAGLDLLYAFNRPQYNGGGFNYDDEFSLYNLYIGYQFTVNFRPLEIFAETRNPFQKDDPKITERRQYYGLAFNYKLF